MRISEQTPLWEEMCEKEREDGGGMWLKLGHEYEYSFKIGKMSWKERENFQNNWVKTNEVCQRWKFGKIYWCQIYREYNKCCSTDK